jgi:hypothetical protein
MKVSCAVPFLAAVAIFILVGTPVSAQLFTPEAVFPHVFNLGENSNSVIYVQDVSESETNEVTVRYIGQNGTVAASETKALAALGSAEFKALPEGFQGAAQVFCDDDCTVTGAWNFGLGGGETFAVGISPLSPMAAGTEWVAPIPVIGPESGFGIAVYNVSNSATSCSAFYYAPTGDLAVIDNFPSAPGIPAGGQTAFLSPNVPARIPPGMVGEDGFQGGLVLQCFDAVLPVVINQNQENGFPTPIAFRPR